MNTPSPNHTVLECHDVNHKISDGGQTVEAGDRPGLIEKYLAGL